MSSTTIRFGKHKGKTWEEVDSQYLNFLLLQDWFNNKADLETYIRNQNIDLVLSFGKYKNTSTKELQDQEYIKFLLDKKIIAPVFFNKI